MTVKATVAFSPETPLEPAYGGVIPVGGRRHVGDTVIMRDTQSPDPVYQRGQRLVEVVVNGRVAASREVPADGREHAVEFSVRDRAQQLDRGAAVPAAPHEPGQRARRRAGPSARHGQSAQWALACIDQLWRVRARRIAPAERAEAEKAYDEARAIYRRIASESPAER